MIWSNIDLDLKDWEGLREEHPEYTEEQLTEEMYEVNNDYLSDERYNLKIQCGNDIIVFGNIGRWNGRAHGYKLIESGNIADCLYTDCDMAEWYVDRDGDLCSTQIHHDGTNYLYYRKFKDGLSSDDKEDFLDKFYEGNGGIVWYEEEYDYLQNLLFAKDGELYALNGLNYLAIGGAYSVDKHLRIRRGAGWWEDEQPSDETKRYVEEQIRAHKVDVILSHTCPRKYIPTEVFLPMVDQSTVDNSTEIWLGQIEESVNYKAWFCGHWHTDKRIDRMHFLYHNFESEEDIGG